MKVDGYTKCVLTAIAVLMGVIALNSGRGTGKAYAAPEAGAEPIAHYQVTNFRDSDGNLHLLIGALDALPFGLGDVAGEAGEPGAFAAEVGTAVRKVRDRASGRQGGTARGSRSGCGRFGWRRALRRRRVRPGPACVPA